MQIRAPLFEIADLSTVWVIAEVFEQDLGLIQIGQPVQITVTAYPGETFRGKVDFIYPDVDPDTAGERSGSKSPMPTGG